MRPLKRPARARHVAAALLGGAALQACGGGVPMLQPARPLSPSQVEAGAGVSSQAIVGRARRELDDARELDAASDGTAVQRQFIRGAVHHALQTPGLAPWVNARVGLEGNNEGAITYTGRSARVGARHAWVYGDYAFSAGLGVASLWLRGPRSSADTDREGLSTDGLAWDGRGFGADVPLMLGWTARAEVLSLWLGARAGFETIDGGLPFVAGGVATSADAEVTRWYAGGTVGLSVGISPVWVRVELGADYSRGEGRVVLPWADGDEQTVKERSSGISLIPAGAVSVRF